MRLKINKKIILTLILLSVFLISSGITAQEISIEEAIQIGLENNKQIKEVRDNIMQLERNLAIERANNDWQLNLITDYDYSFDREEDTKYLNITLGKTFLSGFEITPDTKINVDEDLDTSFNISLKKQLYPQLPTKLAETYYRTDKELLKAGNNLIDQKIESILSWLEIYLNVNRVTTRQNIFEESLSKAEDNLVIVLEREQLGDAGENEILTAELSLENARYSLKEAEIQLEDIYNNLAIELGFPEETILITDNNQYISGLQEKARRYSEGYLKKDMSTLMSIVEENNIDLQANLIDREVLRQELAWLKQENNPGLDLTSSFNTADDDLTLGISLSYQLYDSGQHQLNLKEKEIEIADNIDSYDNLYSTLKQGVKEHIDDIELSQMALKKEELSLARSEYELKVAEKQLAAGLIDYLEYQEYWISAAEAKISLKSLEDQLFLDRLELIKFINRKDIVDIIGGF